MTGDTFGSSAAAVASDGKQEVELYVGLKFRVKKTRDSVETSTAAFAYAFGGYSPPSALFASLAYSCSSRGILS